MTIDNLVLGFLIFERIFKETTADLMSLQHKSQKIEGILALLILDQEELQVIISALDLCLQVGSRQEQMNLKLKQRR